MNICNSLNRYLTTFYELILLGPYVYFTIIFIWKHLWNPHHWTHVVFWFFLESFNTFQQLYPEWCESFLERCARANDDMTGFIGDTDTLMGLRSLHITPSLVPHTRNNRRHAQLLSARSASPESSGGSDIDSLSDVDSSSSILGLDDDRDFPVEILPDLFLGNAVNSEDLEWLKKHHIEVSDWSIFLILKYYK